MAENSWVVAGRMAEEGADEMAIRKELKRRGVDLSSEAYEDFISSHPNVRFRYISNIRKITPGKPEAGLALKLARTFSLPQLDAEAWMRRQREWQQ